jgi:integrase
VLATIRGIMSWYQTRDEDYTSPIVRGMKRNKAKPRARKLNDTEIRQLWQAADGTFGAMLKVLLSTAQRREKVSTMRWTDLVHGDTWDIATEKREKGNAGALKLPQMVLDIINAQPRIAGNPFVFAGRGKTAFNSFHQRKVELDDKLPDLPHWTLHDLRRTACSLMSRAGVSKEHAERTLGHAIPGVEGVYDRYDYGPEKADALKRLAHLIDTIINPPPDNVRWMVGRGQSAAAAEA